MQKELLEKLRNELANDNIGNVWEIGMNEPIFEIYFKNDEKHVFLTETDFHNMYLIDKKLADVLNLNLMN